MNRLIALWCLTIGVLGSVAVAVTAAPQGFPLRPGDWEVTTTSTGGRPIAQHFCYTNETWAKGLTQNPLCTIQQLTVTAAGMHYNLACTMKTAEIKGPVDVTFDGMEHMTGKASMATTVGGKTTTSQTVTDSRWKAMACTAADVNMKPKQDR